MLTVVTSFSPQGFETYGRAFVETFFAHWPASVRLICYWEGERPDRVRIRGERLEGFDLLKTQPCSYFLERHADNLIVQGRSQSAASPWGPKARKDGYSFRHDAYKFARKVFAVAHAARQVERGKLFWIDADVQTHSAAPESLLHKLLPDDTSICYLDRPGYHSELGFVGYNLDHLETHAFISLYEKTYAQDDFIRHRAWDDCHVFDDLIAKVHPMAHKHCIVNTSLAQPFDNSILGLYMVHNKGNRK